MRRITALAVVITTLAVGSSVVAFAPVPFPRPLRPAKLVGKWTVTFANGVVQTCDVRKDGSAWAFEPHRASRGKAEAEGVGVVMTFRDDRVERWTSRDGSVVVEHWFPASEYPKGPRVVGAARRVP